MPYHVFISHKAEDHSIARALKNALKILSQFQLKIHLSEDMPDGTDWRNWIKDNLIKSDKLIFLYTSTGSEEDWRWCVYEIGIFDGKMITNTNAYDANANQLNSTNNMLCIKHSDIKNPPKPIKNIQVSNADEPGIRKLFEQLIYDKDQFSKEPLVNGRDQELFKEQVKKVVNSFNPPVKIDFFEKRLVITLSEIKDKKIQEKDLEESDLSGNYETMAFLKLPQAGGKWKKLYARLKSKGQHGWMDQIRQSIDNIKNQLDPIDVLQSFTSPTNETYIPIITRVERFHFIENKEQVDIPIQISVIFTPMPTLKSPSYALNNMSELTEKWTNYPPTSIVKIKWEKKNGKTYKKVDMIGQPTICAANSEFSKLWDFSYKDYFPNPKDDITDSYLFESIEDYIDKSDLDKFLQDQKKIGKRIIYKNKDDHASVPLKFNKHHPRYRYKNRSYLPYLISKHLIGDVSGPHEMYLLICYIKKFN